MAAVRSLNGALDYQPRSLGALRGFFKGLAIYCDAIRAGGAAAHEYNALVRGGVPHDEAVERVFDEHFNGRR